MWCNILNMLCYESGKTVEFRFLRPTTNYNKITLWIYIFNAILDYALKLTDSIGGDYLSIAKSIRNSRFTIKAIVKDIYPAQIAERICYNYELLRIISNNQATGGDYIGKDVELENRILTELI